MAEIMTRLSAANSYFRIVLVDRCNIEQLTQGCALGFWVSYTYINKDDKALPRISDQSRLQEKPVALMHVMIEWRPSRARNRRTLASFMVEAVYVCRPQGICWKGCLKAKTRRI
jgi:hypothetical protein